MAMNALVPTQTYYLTDAEGNNVAQVPPGMIAQVNQMMAGGNQGAGTLGTLGDAIDAGASIVQGMAIQDDVDDSRDALNRLYYARLNKYAGYKAAFPGSVSVNGKTTTMADLEREVDIQQDKVDRAQNRAFQKSITVLWAQVFGAGARIVGRMQSGFGDMFGGGGGGGGGGWASALMGAGFGFMLGSMSSRRERRNEDEDDRNNVPPIP